MKNGYLVVNLSRKFQRFTTCPVEAKKFYMESKPAGCDSLTTISKVVGGFTVARIGYDGRVMTDFMGESAGNNVEVTNRTGLVKPKGRKLKGWK